MPSAKPVSKAAPKKPAAKKPSSKKPASKAVATKAVKSVKLPKDEFGRVTDVNKAQKQAIKFNKTVDAARSGNKKAAKKVVKQGMRNLGFSSGIEGGSYKYAHRGTEGKQLAEIQKRGMDDNALIFHGIPGVDRLTVQEAAADRVRAKTRTPSSAMPTLNDRERSAAFDRDWKSGSNDFQQRDRLVKLNETAGVKAKTLKKAEIKARTKAAKKVDKLYKPALKATKAQQAIKYF